MNRATLPELNKKLQTDFKDWESVRRFYFLYADASERMRIVEAGFDSNTVYGSITPLLLALEASSLSGDMAELHNLFRFWVEVDGVEGTVKPLVFAARLHYRDGLFQLLWHGADEEGCIYDICRWMPEVLPELVDDVFCFERHKEVLDNLLYSLCLYEYYEQLNANRVDVLELMELLSRHGAEADPDTVRFAEEHLYNRAITLFLRKVERRETVLCQSA